MIGISGSGNLPGESHYSQEFRPVRSRHLPVKEHNVWLEKPNCFQATKAVFGLVKLWMPIACKSVRVTLRISGASSTIKIFSDMIRRARRK